jgi:hypothetical protein
MRRLDATWWDEDRASDRSRARVVGRARVCATGSERDGGACVDGGDRRGTAAARRRIADTRRCARSGRRCAGTRGGGRRRSARARASRGGFADARRARARRASDRRRVDRRLRRQLSVPRAPDEERAPLREDERAQSARRRGTALRHARGDRGDGGRVPGRGSRALIRILLPRIVGAVSWRVRTSTLWVALAGLLVFLAPGSTARA